MNEEMLGKMVAGPSGRHLGRVTVAQEDRFAIEVEGKSVWLPQDVVFSTDENTVTVIFEPPALDRYMLQSGPANPPSERAG